MVFVPTITNALAPRSGVDQHVRVPTMQLTGPAELHRDVLRLHQLRDVRRLPKVPPVLPLRHAHVRVPASSAAARVATSAT